MSEMSDEGGDVELVGRSVGCAVWCGVVVCVWSVVCGRVVTGWRGFIHQQQPGVGQT